jgi:hypothetical protein
MSVRQDLDAIVGYCRAHRGEYQAPPNPDAMWLRIRNMIDVGNAPTRESQATRQPFFSGFFKRSFELSLPQLAAFAAAIVVVVSLGTAVGLRRLQATPPTNDAFANATQATISVKDRMWQQQQVISYWNQRVEVNKVRWSPDMRATFDRNLQVIDQAVNDSLNELNRNPHDEVSEQMLNDALNDKLALLKEFADL